jgi:hypothetical protein
MSNGDSHAEEPGELTDMEREDLARLRMGVIECLPALRNFLNDISNERSTGRYGCSLVIRGSHELHNKRRLGQDDYRVLSDPCLSKAISVLRVPRSSLEFVINRFNQLLFGLAVVGGIRTESDSVDLSDPFDYVNRQWSDLLAELFPYMHIDQNETIDVIAKIIKSNGSLSAVDLDFRYFERIRCAIIDHPLINSDGQIVSVEKSGVVNNEAQKLFFDIFNKIFCLDFKYDEKFRSLMDERSQAAAIFPLMSAQQLSRPLDVVRPVEAEVLSQETRNKLAEMAKVMGSFTSR